MINNPKLSVVVPVYNDASTVQIAVYSILNQTLKEIEIILVDDGSTDNTHSIVSEIACRFRNVKVLRQVNQGSYMARLCGLRQCTAKYVGFVDADDEISHTMYESMVDFANKYDLDVVQCDIDYANSEVAGHVDCQVLTKKEIDDVYVAQKIIAGKGIMSMCDKIYRRAKLLPHLFAYPICYYDDLIFNMAVFVAVEKMGVIHNPLYKYRITNQSSIRNFSERKIHDLCVVIDAREKMLQKYSNPCKKELSADWIKINVCNYIISAALAPSVCFADRKRYIGELFDRKEVCKVVPKIPINVRQVLLWIGRRSPALVVVLVKIVHSVKSILIGERKDDR